MTIGGNTILRNAYLNTILYGVAGTGKTYYTTIYAVAIVENRPIEEVSQWKYTEVLSRFREYRSKGLVESVTFHQSYSYEEFIEGIKPTLDSTEVSYQLHDGVFKRFCKAFSPLDYLIGQDVSSKNAKHYKYVVDNVTSDNVNVKKYKLGSGQDGRVLPIPLPLILGFVQAIKRNELTIMDLKESNLEHFPHYDTTILRYYKDVIVNLVESILLHGVASSSTNRVFIVDEINRANVSNVFGELITLIEPSKRLGNPEEARVTLPYSGETFGVPNDVYILGTMNSTDHSIVSLDSALRRRFHFVEMLPNYELFKGTYIDGVDVAKMVENINLRIEHLIGRDYLIGHAYYMELLKSPTIETLAKVFRYDLIPLLSEYFYNDYSKVRLVLADDHTDVIEHQFIVRKLPPQGLFNSPDFDYQPTYVLQPEAFNHIESYRKV